MKPELSNEIKEFVKEYRREVKKSEPNFRGLTERVRYERFREEMDDYAWRVLWLMKQLPLSPGRKKLTREDIEALQKKFSPVDKKVWEVSSLIRIRAALVFLSHPEKPLSEYTRNLQESYFGGEESLPVYQNHMALRGWFSRRKETYKKWASGYYAQEAVKKRSKAQRPSKEEEAERQYLRYWASKGITNPPPWTPRRRKSNVIPFPRKAASE